MKKTKHFNISVPELGDVPDITQVSNAISDLEDATAGALEIMKAEMQGTKITLTSVSRKTKRTGYYEGMSIRFKSPQDIEPNYLKTISVDELGEQTLSVEYKVNRNEYIDIVYEGNKFTAYPVVVQKTDSVSNNSSILVGTAKGVKTAYDKGTEALNKANQAQSSANNAQSTADGKVSKSGDTMTGTLTLNGPERNHLYLKVNGNMSGQVVADTDWIAMYKKADSTSGGYWCKLYGNGHAQIDAKNLATSSKEVVAAINELNSGKENKIDKKSGFNLDKSDSVTSNGSSTLATSSAVKTAYDKASQAQSTADGKVSKSGDTLTGALNFTTASGKVLSIDTPTGKGTIYTDSHHGHGIAIQNTSTKNFLFMGDNGKTLIDAKNLNTSEKEIVAAINEVKGHFGYEYGAFPLSKANRRECFYHEGTNKVYICVKDYSGEPISHPNSNFEELSFSKHAYDNGFELVRVNTKLWYKKYYNGMLEIFGRTTSAEMKDTYTINFPINFIDTNYMIVHQYIGTVPIYSVVVESMYVDHCVLKLSQAAGNLGAYYICGMWK